MFDPEKLLKQVMNQALSGQLGGKQRRHKSSYGSSGMGGLGGLLGGSSGSSGGGLGGLLGGVLGGSSGRRSSGMSTATKAKIGMGALGLAIAAYEHYKSKNAAPPAAASAPPPQPAYGSAPPPPPPGSPTAPPAPPAANPAQAEEAMHLLRAMICAANADGLIDADERARILGSARDAGLDADDIEALEGELAAPLTVAQLVARTRPAQREQVYVASVIAIGRDTDLEVRYLDDLGQRLGLDAAARESLHAELGL